MLMNIFKPVKNFSKGRTQAVKGVCCHIGEGSASQIYQTFNSEPKSSHYLVLKNGDVWQMVKESDVAWAQGFKDRPTARLVLDNIDLNPNEILISIEFEGFGNQDITELQYINGGKLIGEICQRNNILKDREHIIGHREIRQSKTCPGLINIYKLIALAKNSENTEIKFIQIKISLLQKLLELLKSLASYQRLGAGVEDERGDL